MYKAANLNHLVAFTVVEKPDFYDLCDRLGILDIFEFPFEQFGPIEVLAYSNPRREIFVKESLSQLRQIIIELRNHPSIIVWAAFAEAHEKGGGWGGGDEDWDKYGYQEYSDQIRNLVEDLLRGQSTTPVCATWANSISGWPTPGWGQVAGIRNNLTPTPGLSPSTAALPFPSMRP